MLKAKPRLDLLEHCVSAGYKWRSKCNLNRSRNLRIANPARRFKIGEWPRSSYIGAPMTSVMIPALAAIAGSLVGALGSATGTWITARHQDRRDLLGKQIARREALYSDFIGESAQLLVDAMQHNASDLQKLVPLYALLSRIRLSSAEVVLQQAELVVKQIVNTYPQPNLTAEQIESQAVDGHDPLKEFSDTCRSELSSLLQQL